jgi:ABC-type cobalamin/Fe3+-siderophores transport system ATPase subunit
MSMLDIRHDAVHRGRHAILEPGHIGVPAPASVAVVGINGSGKTSLFMQLSDTLAGGRGRSTVRVSNRAASLVYVPQVPALPGWMRVRDLAHSFRVPTDFVETMPQLLLHEFADRRVNQLSIGQRQALAIALALARRADLTLLDEPFSALDFRRRVGALQLLREHHGRGHSILLSSQSAADLAGACNHYVVIRDGRYVFNGTARQLSPEEGIDQIERQLMQLLGP